MVERTVASKFFSDWYSTDFEEDSTGRDTGNIRVSSSYEFGKKNRNEPSGPVFKRSFAFTHTCLIPLTED